MVVAALALEALASQIAAKGEDPLLAFTRENYVDLMEGEPLIIPVAFRGIDLQTGRPRPSYAAKQQMWRYLHQMALAKAH